MAINDNIEVITDSVYKALRDSCFPQSLLMRIARQVMLSVTRETVKEYNREEALKRLSMDFSWIEKNL